MQIYGDAEDTLWTEEELKAKVILPWLSAIGIARPSDLTLERVHQVRIGREMRTLRHDFLVLSHRRPLMFIEAKRVGHQLTDDDRAQARLYALLNDPMAPLAMLTNGMDTEVYDTATNTRVDGRVVDWVRPYFEQGFVFDPGAALRLRTEAIAKFVSLSQENLRRFSGAQRAYRASHLLGSREELGKKVIPELYVPSSAMAESWRAFLESSEAVYVLLGAAGVGKTNCIWALAEECGAERLALFFDAGRLANGIWNGLCDDFNWAFSAHEQKEQLVRDVRQIATEARTEVLVFIDAIDENWSDGFVLEIDDFCRRLADHGARAMITCRQWDWRRFKRVRDNPTWIAENAQIEMLAQFSPEEVMQAWPKYSSLFRVGGHPTPSVARECCDPFILRAVCEVHAGGVIPHRLDVPDLVGEFARRRLAKAPDVPTLEACLVNMARHLYAQRIQVVAGEVMFSLPAWTASARDELVSAEILAQTGGADYRFSDGPVQDFFVAIKANHWDQISVNQFAAIAEDALSSAIGQQALAWFVRHYEDYRPTVQESVVGRALSYVMERRELIDRWVPGIRAALAPFHDGDVGLLLFMQEGRFTGWWDLEAREDPDSPVVAFAEVAAFVRGQWRAEGVPDAGQASRDLADEISALLGRGRLSRQTRLGSGVPFLHSRTVLDELVFAAAAPWAEALQLKSVRREIGSIYSGGFTRDELREGIGAWCAAWYAERDFVRRQVERGIYKVTVKNGVSSTSYDISKDDREQIHAAAEEMLGSGEPMPLPNVTGDVPPAGLLVALLRQTNTVEFTASLPPPDVDLARGGLIEECYSESTKRQLLQSFFEKGITSLREAARGLFGPVVQEYRPFLGGPLTIIWDLRFSPSVLGEWVVTYALGSSSVGVDVVVESRGPIRMLSDENVLGIDGSNLKPQWVTEMGFSSLLTRTSKAHARRNWGATPIFDWVLGKLGTILPKDLFLEAFSRR